MSTSIYKATYKCDCGVEYGSCGTECAVILKSNNSCDIYTLYHTDSHAINGNHQNPKTTLQALECFGDNYLKALSEVINMKNHNGQTLTESEKKVIFNL